jgi:peptide/nickel transport system ATP-binding protein
MAPTPRPEPLLSVRDLHTWFELRRWGFARAGVVRAVDGVSFALSPGEAVAVVGESGCGKSTLARTILGLVPPTRGDIVLGWHSLERRGGRGRHADRARIGFVQQDPYGALPPFMDVRRILVEPLLIHKVGDRREREARVREALEEVKLTPAEDFLPKFPHMLSGGQQQRVVIARAIILRPRLLVADEPVSMLDASVRVEILELLRSLQQAHNLSLLYITHDLSTVRHFAERVLVMYAGKIVEQAPVRDLLQDPKHPYTQALLAAIPDPEPGNAQRMREVPAGEPPNLLNPPSGCRFHPRCPVAIKDLCEEQEPPDLESDGGHRVACWLHARC